MGRATHKFSPAQRFLVYELKKGGKSGRKIQEICARGYKEAPPFSISPNRANEIAREVADERGELYDTALAKRPAHEVTAVLARRMIHMADRETTRLDKKQRRGQLKGDETGKWATALTRLHVLLERTQPGGTDESVGDEVNPGKDDKDETRSSWVAEALGEG